MNYLDEIQRVEPTNNVAEGKRRHAVMVRKISAWSQLADGMASIARLLTVVTTLRQRGESPYAYLLEASRRARSGEPAPSLLPAEPSARGAAA